MIKSLEAILKNVIHGNPCLAETINQLYINKPASQNILAYLGIDMTGYLHLGHLVCLYKLQQFKELGFDVVVILGDLTASVGDPTSKNTKSSGNSDEFIDSAKQILDKLNLPYIINDWFTNNWEDEDLSVNDLGNFMNLLSKFSVSDMLQKRMFRQKLDNKEHLSLSQFIYPVLQAIDSYMIEADIQVGGIDQQVNIEICRDFQQKMGQKACIPILMPLLLGSDGQKMSKSLGNTIMLNDSPDEIFGKIMNIPDSILESYIDLLPCGNTMEVYQKHGAMMAKKSLGYHIVNILYNKEEAIRAQDQFLQPTRTLCFTPGIKLKDFILSQDPRPMGVRTLMALYKQNGVSVDGIKIDGSYVLPDKEVVVKASRSFFCKLIPDRNGNEQN